MSLQTILSSPNEVDEWRRNDLPTDEHALQNVVILRSCGDDRSRAWPLLIDPHNQAELWIRALHEGEAFCYHNHHHHHHHHHQQQQRHHFSVSTVLLHAY